MYVYQISTHTHKKLYLPHYVCVFYSVCFATSTKVSPVSCCCSRWRWPMTATAINTMQFKRRRCWRRCCRSCVQNTHKRIYRMKIAHTHTRTHTRESGGESAVTCSLSWVTFCAASLSCTHLALTACVAASVSAAAAAVFCFLSTWLASHFLFRFAARRNVANYSKCAANKINK